MERSDQVPFHFVLPVEIRVLIVLPSSISILVPSSAFCYCQEKKKESLPIIVNYKYFYHINF